ncbi:NAD(P)-dependent oxidoreductase [Plantactinospora sp. KLBMP9567]|uniref:NAD(P)-dependent oxidoreductase n=1 Tax=Plantactinospora sp. KLBMP9567 TaxID=3085900 RepID=UPI002981DF1B|nr:NAD(P)-dependent oxidoreductase [Plantactinospora sp. KLBMP9567]MDW5325164.1 NAD(P)-dependent oxidoreductase [Plantactinospora sp. KLBMP9567]
MLTGPLGRHVTRQATRPDSGSTAPPADLRCRTGQFVRGEAPMAETQRVAVLGLGGMGQPMAANLVRAGLPTVVWNRRPGPARQLGAQGAEVADSPADAVRRADVVITMVTNGDAIRAIALDQGMLAAMAEGAIWAQMSTIGVSDTERIAGMVREQRPDVVLLDAPVAGSRGPAERRQLVVLASGPEQARGRIAPVFDALGQRTVWAGPVGAGSRLKLVNNMLLAFLAEGIAEAMALGHSLGLDRAAVLGALQGSPLVSPWAAEKLERIGRDEYSAQYPLSLGLKDVNLALYEVDIDRFPVANSLAAQWQRAVEHGLGDEDITVLARALQH